MSDDTRISIGGRLKEAREYLGISQEEAAKKANVPRSAISLIESGQRKLDFVELMALAELYQRPVEYFSDDNAASSKTREVDLIARNFAKLSDNDKVELLRFSEFLALRSKREK